ncbi:hypothetical protein ACFL60_04895 [Candidatus Omnitrophota bacterium]
MGKRDLIITLNVFFVCMALVVTCSDGTASAQQASNSSTGITTPADTLETAEQVYMHMRGLEQKKSFGDETLRSVTNNVLYIPRKIVRGVFVSAGHGAYLIDESKIIDKASDFIYLYERRIGWYPVIAYSASSGIAGGAKLFYNNMPIGSSLGGYYGQNGLWQVKFNAVHSGLLGKYVWRLKFTGKIKNRENLKFYGIGSNPENDSRNAYNPGREEDYGLFAQRLSRLQLVSGIRPAEHWELFYTVFYQKRDLSVPDDNDNENIDKTFDVTLIPGIQNGAGTDRLVYNEIAARYDTRRYRGQISPGVRVEGYVGISEGVGNSTSRFLRSGLDTAFYIPVIKKNRLIVPRIVFDTVENIHDEADVTFTDYPRQPSFRGTSSRSLLRNDNISVVPSLEYQWPLSFSIRGHVFMDYLLVSDTFESLTFSQAPYAYGFGVDFHGFENELARITVSHGSEGVRVQLTVGLKGHDNDRTEWE